MLESFLDTQKKKKKSRERKKYEKNTVLWVRKKQLLTPDHEISGEKNFEHCQYVRLSMTQIKKK